MWTFFCEIYTMNPVESYITDYPNEEIQLLLHETHHFLMQNVPQVQAAIKWKVPFYTYIKPLCYLNVPKTKDKIYIGFHKAHLMSEQYPNLLAEGRTQIKAYYIHQIDDIFTEELSLILQEAMLVNEQL